MWSWRGSSGRRRRWWWLVALVVVMACGGGGGGGAVGGCGGSGGAAAGMGGRLTEWGSGAVGRAGRLQSVAQWQHEAGLSPTRAVGLLTVSLAWMSAPASSSARSTSTFGLFPAARWSGVDLNCTATHPTPLVSATTTQPSAAPCVRGWGIVAVGQWGGCVGPLGGDQAITHRVCGAGPSQQADAGGVVSGAGGGLGRGGKALEPWRLSCVRAASVALPHRPSDLRSWARRPSPPRGRSLG